MSEVSLNAFSDREIEEEYDARGLDAHDDHRCSEECDRVHVGDKEDICENDLKIVAEAIARGDRREALMFLERLFDDARHRWIVAMAISKIV